MRIWHNRACKEKKNRLLIRRSQGSYTLYTYMMKQRSKVMGGGQSVKKTQ